MSRFGAIIVFSLLCCLPARAEKLVVMKFSGDRGGLARSELVEGLRKDRVKLMPPAQYFAAAAKRRIPPNRRLAKEGISTLAPRLGLDGVVVGSVAKGGWLQLRALSPRGEEVWSVRMKLWEGHVGHKAAAKLGAAMVAALKEQRKAPKPAPEPSTTPAPSTPEAQAPSTAPSETPPSPPTPPVTPPTSPEPTPPAVSAPGPEGAPNSTTRFLTLALTGTSTWRSYQATPAVVGEEQQSFNGAAYTGVQIRASLFPFAGREGLIRGLGLSASYGRGSSKATVEQSGPNATSTVQTVNSLDQSFLVNLHGRYDFELGRNGMPGFVELLLGGGYRGFAPDPKSGVPLAGASRAFPSIGIGAGIRLHRLALLDVGGYLLLGPGPGAKERQTFGDPAHASGVAAEVGLSGDVVGPVEYVLRLRYERYSDTFAGSTAVWLNGGTASESFTVLQWGVGVHF